MKLIFKCLFVLMMSISLCACSVGSADVPKGDVETIKISNVVKMTLTEARKQLEKDGFTIISVKNFDENWDSDRYIVAEQNYQEGTEVESNKEIILTCLKKCYLYFDITSESNWIFSTYDIDFYMDDNLVGTVANGENLSNLFTVLEGTYELKAVKSGDDSVNGDYTLKIKNDMTFRTELSHTSVSIKFTDVRESDGVAASVIEEFQKPAEEVEYAVDYSASKEFQECKAGSYVINVPDSWTKNDSGAYFSADNEAMIYVIENEEYEWTDELADLAVEQLTQKLGEKLIETNEQNINKIKMRCLVYRESINDLSAIGTMYLFVDSETANGIQVYFDQLEDSKIDHSKDFEKMINSIHKSEVHEEPTETATPEPTKEPSQTPEPEKKQSLFYTTNDKETAKLGNTGVYAYSSSKSYTQYYIINFDEGYVYYFTDGNGDETCERLKIDSGDLNSRMQITYHDGGDTWNNYFYFKWKNQPDSLILEDNTGYQYQFRYTDLDDALKIRDTKKMIDL